MRQTHASVLRAVHSAGMMPARTLSATTLPAGVSGRAGLVGPAVGVAAMGGAAAAMVALAWAFPEAAGLPGMCNPFAGDFGCGHGFGCACHMLPPAVAGGG